MKWLLRWETFALGSALFAGLTALLGKLGVAQVSSNLATLIRTLTVLILTAVVLSWRQEWQRPGTIQASTWAFLILSGITTGLSWLCYYHALQLGPVSKVASIDKLSVAFVILLGVLFLGEKLTWPVVLGGGLILLGAIIMVAF